MFRKIVYNFTKKPQICRDLRRTNLTQFAQTARFIDGRCRNGVRRQRSEQRRQLRAGQYL